MKLIITLITLTIIGCVYVEKCTEKHFYEKVYDENEAMEKERAK